MELVALDELPPTVITIVNRSSLSPGKIIASARRDEARLSHAEWSPGPSNGPIPRFCRVATQRIMGKCETQNP